MGRSDSAVSCPDLAFSGVTSEWSDPATAPLDDGEQLFLGLAQGGPQVPGSCSPPQTLLSLLQGQCQGQGLGVSEDQGAGGEVELLWFIPRFGGAGATLVC